MANPGLLDEEIMQTVTAVNEFGSIRNTHLNIGMSRSAIKRRIEIALERGLISGNPTLPGFEITQISTTEDADGNVKSRSIQQKPETDKEPFQMPVGHALKGVSALVDSEGNVKQKWLKADRKALAVEEIIKAAKEALTDIRGKSTTITPPRFASDEHVSVIPMVDFHLGMMSWGEETGADWDLKIAERVIMGAMGKAISLTPPSAECVILGLGDLFHADGYEPFTRRSKNVLDVDGRYPKILRTGLRMVRGIVDLALANHETVHLRILQGNHSEETELVLAAAMSMFYENEPRVIVDDSPSKIWWKRFGKVFFGATHGHLAKMKDLPLMMAADRPEDWAASTNRRIWTGHLHSDKLFEEGGVVVSCMRTPIQKDAFHSEHKWRSGRSVYTETFRVDGSGSVETKINL